MILSLLDISITASVWVCKNVYYAGRYMVYGHQKTESEKLDEKLEKIEEILKKNLEKEEMMLEKISLLDNNNITNLRRSC